MNWKINDKIIWWPTMGILSRFLCFRITISPCYVYLLFYRQIFFSFLYNNFWLYHVNYLTINKHSVVAIFGIITAYRVFDSQSIFLLLKIYKCQYAVLMIWWDFENAWGKGEHLYLHWNGNKHYKITTFYRIKEQ